MRTSKWLILLVGLLACGLIAAGCGDDDDDELVDRDDGGEHRAEDTTREDTSSEDTGDTSDNESIDSESFYNACTDTAAGTPAEATAESVCGQARDALEQCANQAEASWRRGRS